MQDEGHPLPSPFRGGVGGGVIPTVVPSARTVLPASGMSDLSPRPPFLRGKGEKGGGGEGCRMRKRNIVAERDGILASRGL